MYTYYGPDDYDVQFEFNESLKRMTLLPVLSKWYEQLMMGRTEEGIRNTINPLQGIGPKGG